ncbi:MAG TPA: hypothetical protein VK833_06980, partial [Gillisia sp.]|nr:hypothetical protein [Gillisia sp.]
KGIKALGNQLTAEKLKQLNLLEPVPFQPEEILTEDIEVNEEETLDPKEGAAEHIGEITGKKLKNEDSQINLFDE